jgi:TetR/AcrR family transcriptional repressor of mexJK operon
VGTPFLAEIARLGGTADLPAGLRELARAYLAAVMQPPVLQLRRLIIGEAARLPDLARTYYERGPERFVAALAGCFGQLTERGLLRVDDPALAAGQFAFLVLGRALDKSLFCGDTGVFGPAELTALADSAAGVFLAAYAA